MLISDILTDAILDVGGDADDSDLPTAFLRYCKSALRRFPRWCRGRLLRTTKSGSLTAGASTMSLPSGTRQVFQAYYLSDDDGRRIDIPKMDFREFNRNYRANDTGAPEGFIIRGNTVEFTRASEATRTIYFEAQGEISSVVAGDTWSWTEDDSEILKDGIKFYYYSNKEDEVQQANYGKLFQDGLGKIDAEYIRYEMADHVEEAD